MALQAQNSALLQSMDKNSERQLRLQRVVEGLSVVAVSYYAVSLLSYILRAVADYVHIPHDALVAYSVLPVMILVWIFLRGKVKHIVETAN